MTKGPWGGGGGNRGDDRDRPNDPRDPNRDPDRDPSGGPRRPGERPIPPEIEEMMRRGQDQLRVLMGGKGRPGQGGNGGSGGNGPRLPQGPMLSRGAIGLAALGAAVLWAFASFYQVKLEERSVELMFGRFVGVGEPGLNFAPWPVVTREVIPVSTERSIEIGTGKGGTMDSGLMLTGDQNIVDVEFQVVWNITDPSKFLFNIADPQDTIRAVSESAMRDIIARSELAPILNRDRGLIAGDLRNAVQATLDSYDAGINIVRVNFNRADPPREVIDSFREVQAAQQERDRLEKEADAYANRVLAGARGEAAQLVENAEGYRAEVVNNAQGEASRFNAVYDEYIKAPEVTRRRMYLETMEKVLGDVDKVILDGVSGGQGGQGGGVVPYLPLDQLRRGGATTSEGGN
ncbi:FtsH protease activity modulator HflK [Paracoccus sp. p4-l81]|uniref:FtsH protease activity modulator HflK n=1 Tax=unclassified Paracoccus (in: a-proteobacteria) TaxID=2688777 RepID=UPI0035B82854